MTRQPINPLDILIHLDRAEGDNLGFKSAQGGLPKSLWETYCVSLCSQIQRSLDLLTERRSALITAAVTGQIPLEAMRA